jgi:hypothetical protein
MATSSETSIATATRSLLHHSHSLAEWCNAAGASDCPRKSKSRCLAYNIRPHFEVTSTVAESHGSAHNIPARLMDAIQYMAATACQ